MATVEAKQRKSANDITNQSEWLQATLSGVDEKKNAILHLLENNLSPFENAEIHQMSKNTVKKMVQDLCSSYCSLAEKYQQLESASRYTLSSTSSSPLKEDTSQLNGRQHNELPRNLDDSLLEAIYSHPESTVEDADIQHCGASHDFEHLNTLVHRLSKNKGSITEEPSWLIMEKLKMLKLVEDNTQVQLELIRRNTEKREIIKKLQEQVTRLESENNVLQHRLSYSDCNELPVEVNSPRRGILMDRFFRGCSR